MNRLLFSMIVSTSLLLPAFAQASCESLKERIYSQIVGNGVPDTGFTLEIVPAGDSSDIDGKVVGNCESNQYQLIYKRYHNNDAPVINNTRTASDELDITPTIPSENSRPVIDDFTENQTSKYENEQNNPVEYEQNNLVEYELNEEGNIDTIIMTGQEAVEQSIIVSEDLSVIELSASELNAPNG